jgi:hypothetical protein
MKTIFQYAAKVVVGKSLGKVVAPGEYWTAVNVHNPHYKTIYFKKKIAIGLPHEKAGRIWGPFSARLRADEALEIDRDDIMKHAQTDDFLKGFVVIESPYELDVVSVYTVADAKGQVVSIHTERVPARKRVVGQPDLIPVPTERGDYCRQNDDGDLVVRVANQGSASSGPCSTAVTFTTRLGFVTSTQPTPSLAPGASVDLIFPFPRLCFTPDCYFTITVDSKNEVMEAGEGNNMVKGHCIG